MTKPEPPSPADSPRPPEAPVPTAEGLAPAAEGVATRPATSAGKSRLHPGLRFALWTILLGYCVFSVGLELSRDEPRWWMFVLRGVVGLVALVNAVATLQNMRAPRS